MDYRRESPQILRDFLAYHENVLAHSQKTVDEYYLDLRTFFRYLKLRRGLVPENTDFSEIDIMDVDLAFVGSVTLTEVYDFLGYLSRERQTNPKGSSAVGLSVSSRSRKISSIRSFYKYLTAKTHQLEVNPVKDMDTPKRPRTLPRHLTLEESETLLSTVDSRNAQRNYCILTLFLNCGMRISELVGINMSDIRYDHIVLHGKGGKDRVVYLNSACVDALNSYLAIRKDLVCTEPEALFVSEQHNRIGRAAVHAMIKTQLKNSGLDAEQYSAHKLRHTAATLMLQNGVDLRTLQEILGHEHVNTTEIYTHIDNSDLRIAASANPLAKFTPKDK